MKKVAIRIAIANTRGAVDPEEVFIFIESQEGDFETYEFFPRDGGIYASGLDYGLLLNTAGSIASLASILWMAYDKYIAPKKDSKSDAGIIVSIQRDDGTSEQYWIGNMHKNKEVFIQDFSSKVEGIRNSELPGQSTDKASAELKIGTLWIRRK